MLPLEQDLARKIIDFGLNTEDLRLEPASPETTVLVDLGLPWPAGEGPVPLPWPAGELPALHDSLPEADVLVVTWTVAEHEALADVLTPGYGRNTWARYVRRFDEHYAPQIRNGAPAQRSKRLGSYFRTRVGERMVLCFKSELHLNQDGIASEPGRATLPVKDLFRQLIDEVRPSLVITVGTAGATFPPERSVTVDGMTCPPHELGDVIITRGAKFRLQREFANEDFARQAYRCSEFEIPTRRLAAARNLLRVHTRKLVEPAFAPPHNKYAWPLTQPVAGFANAPDLKIDGEHFPAFHPMLTTDFFEFGTSENGLEQEGCGVEMGDAVLAMVVDEMKGQGLAAPHWLVIRNASDPQINGKLPTRDSPDIAPELRRALDMQAHWAVWYYETYGYWTSVNSAVAVWAMVA
ncbi:hypothetical protein [Massilia psychrophila]|uniref:Uncharacterized protein n=1 Tax=Massilia psychrophila TaxID=1603353 RepID=A0A2G8SZH3_9BURK|nr:hypothetical protein [Massilia psychrophila]PIL39186.1 hypothetical protein CR103_13940 [Massilia psychrophila]GGE82265.1 hypothetical protein GCM10008020_28970 [Massilia psychrophila]